MLHLIVRTLLIVAVQLALPTAMAAEILQLQQVAEGVYVHQGRHELPNAVNHGAIANIGFIIGERCVAVIDSGGNPEQGRDLRRTIEQITSMPVCYVINTHMHPDHVLGNVAFKQPGISFVGHHKLGAALASRALFYRERFGRDLGFSLEAEDFVLPDREVKDTLQLDLGERLLTLTAHRTAHTDNDLTVLDQRTGTLWLGDLLFLGHLPVIDGSLNGWIEEIDRLKQRPAQRAVAGHGPVVNDWPSALAAEERYLRGLQQEIRNALRSHKTMEQAMAIAGQSLREDWSLFEDFHKRNVASAFAELEWEDD